MNNYSNMKLVKCPKCNIETPVDDEGVHIPHKQFLSAEWCISPTDYYGENPIRAFPLQILDRLEKTMIILQSAVYPETAYQQKAEIKKEIDELRFYWIFILDQYYRE